MIYLSGLVGFLLVLTAEAKVGNSSELSFCTETKQCLLFKLICVTDKYEVRHYDSVKLVSTDETSMFMEIAAMRAFKRLYRYITGDNAAGKKMEMTAPVIVKISPKSFFQMGTYTMSFVLSAEDQSNTPEPNDSQVYINVMKPVDMYVRKYGGWFTSMNEGREARTLSSDLGSMDAEYKKGFHYAAVYNGPMTMFNRHNEAWYVAEDDPVCFSSEELESSMT